MILSDSTMSLLASDDSSSDYLNAKPFPWYVIDNFFEEAMASSIADEFPLYDSKFLDAYSNQIEEKKLVNHWNRFGPSTYQAFTCLCSSHFSQQLTHFTKSKNPLSADIGLH